MGSSTRIRLDDLLVERGLVENRSMARRLILAGKVWSGTQRLEKPGHSVARDMELSVEQAPRFVSRGGEKLSAFLDANRIDCAGKCALDIGASTGGFTDCLLQYGARHVTCVDVGRAQLHQKLRLDPRVTNLEKINARFLEPGQLPRSSYDIVVVDVSFISLRLILPPAWSFVSEGGMLVALVKPQFEIGRTEARRYQGVITDLKLREQVRQTIEDFAASLLKDSVYSGWVESPIHGADGNLEYLLGWHRRSPGS